MMRFNYSKLTHGALKPLGEIAEIVKAGTLGQPIIDLVNLRASQLNGCAFCIDMHVKEMRLHGARDLRAHHVSVWRESSLFDARERAALEWTEEVTRLNPKDPVDDAVYGRVKAQFSEQELSDLTFAVGAINFWNRVAISARSVPGSLDKYYGLDKADY